MGIFMDISMDVDARGIKNKTPCKRCGARENGVALRKKSIHRCGNRRGEGD